MLINFKHINTYGTAKLACILYLCKVLKLSFQLCISKQTVTAISPVYKPFEKSKGFIFLPMLITSKFSA